MVKIETRVSSSNINFARKSFVKSRSKSLSCGSNSKRFKVAVAAASEISRDSDSNRFNFFGLTDMVTMTPMSSLLLVIPFAILSWAMNWASTLTFLLSLAALVPLAERLGFATEQMTLHSNDAIGALLNVTLGNATELIVSIVALSGKFYRLVQLSLLGSILSNELLVLGLSFFFGGLRFKRQSFSKTEAQHTSTMLLLASTGLLFPTVLKISNEDQTGGDKMFSRLSSIFLLITYCAYVYYEVIQNVTIY